MKQEEGGSIQCSSPQSRHPPNGMYVYLQNSIMHSEGSISRIRYREEEEGEEEAASSRCKSCSLQAGGQTARLETQSSMISSCSN
jgi:hypothetical protein